MKEAKRQRKNFDGQRKRYPWGYSVEYYLSSVNDCSPIYAGHYYSKHMLPVDRLDSLLGMLEGEKRISFDKAYAEELYRRYNGKEPYDDREAVKELKGAFEGRKVCVIAPGKSLTTEHGTVWGAVKKADVTVSLNCDMFGSDYELVTRQEVFREIRGTGKRIITLSSITREPEDNVSIIDYYRWITVDGDTRDSSGFVILNLLTGLGAKEIWLAGFDGFHLNMGKNYYDDTLNRAVTPEQTEERNLAFRRFVAGKQKTREIVFVTPSLYDQRINRRKGSGAAWDSRAAQVPTMARPTRTGRVPGMDRLNLVFDCDGVLIDSSRVQQSAFYGSYQEIVGDDRCPPFSEYMKYTGDSLPNIFRKMGLPVEMAGPYRRISSEAIDQIIINHEAVALIREMRKIGVRSSICTGKDRSRMIDILRYYGIEDIFDAIVCADDVAEPKPSPVPVLRAIEEMGGEADIHNTIVIGDGYYDIVSARRAGCGVVLVLWYGDEGVPREADHTVSTVAELRELLMEMLYGEADVEEEEDKNVLRKVRGGVSRQTNISV